MAFFLTLNVPSLLALICLVLLVVWYVQQNRKIPSGVPRVPYLPIIGSIPWAGSLQQFSEHVGKSLYDLSAKYGQVFYFRLIGIDMLVVNGYEAVKDVLGTRGADFAGRAGALQLVKRPQVHPFGVLDGDYTDQWKEQRKFLLHNLRMFGFGKRRFEGHILEEIQCFLLKIEKTNSLPFDFRPYASNCMSNVIISMIFGERYDYGDENFIFLSETFRKYVMLRAAPPLAELHPDLKWWPTAVNYRRNTVKLTDQLLGFFQKKIDEHWQTFDKDNLRDIIDGYILENKQDPNTKFSIQQLKHSIFELFIGGLETTTTFMQWAMIYMANNQDVQDKVKAEIDSVFGNEIPSLIDRQKLPYTEAVLIELKRIASVLTLTAFHKALRDTEVCGVPVAKDTMIAVNLYSVLHDPGMFPDPDEFRPERFLTKDMQFIRDERVIPFGLGPRVCLGQQLAKQELFLFFTSILHRFRITPPPGVDKICVTGFTRISYHPKPHMICARPYC